MSASNPYYQTTLDCGCVVETPVGSEYGKLVEQTQPCAVHIPGETLAAREAHDD